MTEIEDDGDHKRDDDGDDCPSKRDNLSNTWDDFDERQRHQDGEKRENDNRCCFRLNHVKVLFVNGLIDLNTNGLITFSLHPLVGEGFRRLKPTIP